MAVFEQRGQKWRAKIRRKGQKKSLSKTFNSRAAAKQWATKIESELDNGLYVDEKPLEQVTVAKIIDDLIYSYERFGIAVCKPKQSQLNIIKKFFSDMTVADLSVDDVLDFAAYRRETVCASTLQTQVYYLQEAVKNSRLVLRENVVEIAINELKKKKIIMGSEWRDRRLEDGEYERLIEAAKASPSSSWIIHAIDFALASSMRQGEIHALTRSAIKSKRGVIEVWRKDPKAEGGKRLCKVPILPGMREILLRGGDYFGDDRLFHVARSASISDRFAETTKAAGIDDLTFHDLRHEAISRFFEQGMDIERVKLMSGHKTLEQLSRYLHLRPEDFAREAEEAAKKKAQLTLVK